MIVTVYVRDSDAIAVVYRHYLCRIASLSFISSEFRPT